MDRKALTERRATLAADLKRVRETIAQYQAKSLRIQGAIILIDELLAAEPQESVEEKAE